MKEKPDQFMPLARTNGLVVQHLSDEVLVYDTERHKAHCLNSSAAQIWAHCDGKTTIAEMAKVLAEQAQQPVDEQVVWVGLDQLSKAKLLPEPVARIDGSPKLSRRQLVMSLGLLSLPLVTSILAPTAHAAASCGVLNDPCGGPGDLPCCPGLNCLGGVCG